MLMKDCPTCENHDMICILPEKDHNEMRGFYVMCRSCYLTSSVGVHRMAAINAWNHKIRLISDLKNRGLNF